MEHGFKVGDIVQIKSFEDYKQIFKWKYPTCILRGEDYKMVIRINGRKYKITKLIGINRAEVECLDRNNEFGSVDLHLMDLC